MMGIAKENQQLENNCCIIKRTHHHATMSDKNTMVIWCHCAPQATTVICAYRSWFCPLK